MSLAESIVAAAALECFLLRQGYGGRGGEQFRVAPPLIPAFSQGEKEKDGEVVLVGRLREAIGRLTPANANRNPHPTSPTERGEEARATIRQFRRVQIERRASP
jgi:hypothetical protein